MSSVCFLYQANNAIPRNDWQQYLTRLGKEFYFLIILFPLLDFIFQALNSYRTSDQLLLRLLSEESLRVSIFHQTQTDLYLMIIRVCVMEMHMAKEGGYLTAKTSAERFQQFILLLAAPDEMLAFLQKYPVLNEKLFIFTQFYIESTKVFLNALSHDFSAVKKQFLPNASTYQVTYLSAAGDRHRQGKSVRIVTFQCDEEVRHVVYKPRSLATDIAYNIFIDWVNERGQFGLRYARTLNYSHHGWCEFIVRESCQAKKDIETYYYRLGALLAVCYLLNATDMHFENLLSDGKCPVIIDLECLVFPVLTVPAPKTFQGSLHTVLTPAILPSNIYLDNGRTPYDVSAFAGARDQVSPEENLVVVDAGTDRMRIIRQATQLSEDVYQVKYKNEPIASEKYFDFFKDGFSKAYQIFLKYKKFLQGKRSPLRRFQQVEVRLVLRGTREYTKLLRESYHPELFFDAAKYRAHFDWLKPPYANQAFVDYAPQIVSEVRDLLNGEVPLFYGMSNDKKIYDAEDKPISGRTYETGYQALLSKVDGLSPADFKTQLCIINQSLLIYQYNLHKNKKKAEKFFNSLTMKKNFILDQALKSQCLHYATQLLNQVLQSAMTTNKNFYFPSANVMADDGWIPGFSNHFNLYGGLPGIILTVAYANKIKPRAQYTTFLKQAITQIKNFLKAIQKDNFSLGFYSGLGGLLYLFVELQKIIRNARFKKDIQSILTIADRLLTQKNKKEFDVVGGSAGYLAALLAVQESIPAAIFKRQAKACVNHLLKVYPDPARMPTDIVFEKYKGSTILGVAHGLSGVLWALARYQLLFPSKKIKQWINAALQFEREAYSKEKGCWPNEVVNELQEKPKENIGYNTSWCYGSTGIGLARMDLLLHRYPDKRLTEEVTIAIQTNLKNGFSKALNLCHGSMGALDLILSAEKCHLLEEGYAASILKHFIFPLLKNQKVVETETIGPVFIPTLMTGLAGVAYQLLRCVDPQRIPSILLPGLTV